MRHKFFKIVSAGAIGALVTCGLLATFTNFLLVPSIVVGTLTTVAAIAAYIPPKGLPIVICLALIVCTFATSTFLISTAFSAVPQRQASMAIPIAATLFASVALVAYGYHRNRDRERL